LPPTLSRDKTLDLLYLDKNILPDISAYLEPPDLPTDGDEDLAVDFIVESEEIVKKQEKGESSNPPELETEN